MEQIQLRINFDGMIFQFESLHYKRKIRSSLVGGVSRHHQRLVQVCRNSFVWIRLISLHTFVVR